MKKKIWIIFMLAIFSISMLGAMEWSSPVEGVYGLKSGQIRSRDVNI